MLSVFITTQKEEATQSYSSNTTLQYVLNGIPDSDDSTTYIKGDTGAYYGGYGIYVNCILNVWTRDTSILLHMINFLYKYGGDIKQLQSSANLQITEA